MSCIFDILKCPVCGEILARKGNSLLCGKGHNFDVSKSGYVNMLPPGREKNSRTGDEREMVKARVEFLSQGYYGEISRRLAEILCEHLPKKDNYVLCDMGCGEGYHTCCISNFINNRMRADVLSFGFDASKYAAECACKRSKSLGFMQKEGIGADFDSKCQVYFMPANIFALPLVSHSADVALSMFAPVACEESARILREKGILAVVSSGKEHLIEMRNIIYDDVRLSESIPPVPNSFCESARYNLHYSVEIKSADDIKSLFMMTPFYYKTTEHGRQMLYEKNKLTVTVDVNFSVFEVE